MSDTATKQDLQTTARNIVDEIGQVMDVVLTRVDERFNKLETRLDKQDEEIRQILLRLDLLINNSRYRSRSAWL